MSASSIVFLALAFALPVLLALYGGRAVWRDQQNGAWGLAVGGFLVVAASVGILGLLAYGFWGFVVAHG